MGHRLSFHSCSASGHLSSLGVLVHDQAAELPLGGRPAQGRARLKLNGGDGPRGRCAFLGGSRGTLGIF